MSPKIRSHHVTHDFKRLLRSMIVPLLQKDARYKLGFFVVVGSPYLEPFLTEVLGADSSGMKLAIDFHDPTKLMDFYG